MRMWESVACAHTQWSQLATLGTHFVQALLIYFNTTQIEMQTTIQRGIQTTQTNKLTILSTTVHFYWNF